MKQYGAGDLLQNNPFIGQKYMRGYIGHELIKLKLGDEYVSSKREKKSNTHKLIRKKGT